MQQPAVEDRAEPPVVPGERRDVGRRERRIRQPAFLGARGGGGHGRRAQVDADHGVATLSQRQRQRGVTAAGVEHFTVYGAVGVDDRGVFRLRRTDTPRGVCCCR